MHDAGQDSRRIQLPSKNKRITVPLGQARPFMSHNGEQDKKDIRSFGSYPMRQESSRTPANTQAALRDMETTRIGVRFGRPCVLPGLGNLLLRDAGAAAQLDES
jgi:hypothetical protein